jgi:hypothetical protein
LGKFAGWAGIFIQLGLVSITHRTTYSASIGTHKSCPRITQIGDHPATSVIKSTFRTPDNQNRHDLI